MTNQPATWQECKLSSFKSLRKGGLGLFDLILPTVPVRDTLDAHPDLLQALHSKMQAALPQLPRTRQGRRQAALDIVAIRSLNIHKAAKWSCIAYSTLQSAVQSTKSTANSVGRLPALDRREELMIVSLLTKMAAVCTPLTNDHLVDAAFGF